MSYNDLIINKSGILSYWPCNEAPGSTTLIGYGPSATNITLNTARAGGSATFVNNGLIPEYQNSLSIPGGAGTVTNLVTGTALNPFKLTNAITLVGWVKQSAPSTNNATALIARGGNWSIAFRTNGQVTGQALATAFSNTVSYVQDQIRFYAVTWDSNYKEVELYINGVRESRAQTSGTISTSTDALAIGSDSNGNALTGQIQGLAIFSRRLSAGEIRELYLSGASDKSEYGLVDFSSDYKTVVTNSSYVFCAGCGGKIRNSETRMRLSSGVSHVSCYKLCIHQGEKTIISGSTLSDVESQLKKIIMHGIQSYAFSALGNTKRWDNTNNQFLNNSGVTVGERYNLGMAEQFAATARWLNLPVNDWMVQGAIRIVNKVIADQRDNGSLVATVNGIASPADNHFPMLRICTVAILLRPYLSNSDWNKWKAAIVKCAEFMKISSAKNNNAPEANWYTNGNFEINEAIIYSLVYKITADAFWSVAATDQLNFAINPDQNKWPGFGLVVTQTGTSADWSDYKAYMAEKGSAVGAVPGLDWSYLQVQQNFCLQAWVLTRNPVWLQYANAFRNKLFERVNTTTWIADLTGGSRQSYTDKYRSPSEIILMKGGRSDITSASIVDQWRLAVEPDVRSWYNSFTLSTFDSTISLWILSASDFPVIY